MANPIMSLYDGILWIIAYILGQGAGKMSPKVRKPWLDVP